MIPRHTNSSTIPLLTELRLNNNIGVAIPLVARELGI